MWASGGLMVNEIKKKKKKRAGGAKDKYKKDWTL